MAVTGEGSPRRAGGRSRIQRSPAEEAAFRRACDEARDRHSLSDIIGRHTTLKRRGRELEGLCPFHSERTPSFQVNDAKGFYHCFGCGRSGDHYRFLMDKEGMTFREAYETLSGDAFPTISEEERAKRKAESEEAERVRVQLALSIWAKSVPPEGTPAEVYARSRGITMPLPPSVRFVMTPRWHDPETGEVGRDVPAMCCGLSDAAGEIVGVQCIFLENGGRSKYARPRRDGTIGKAKLTFGRVIGSAFRIGPESESIVICEGPEDGLTLHQETGRTIWVACGTALMPMVDLPPSIVKVTLAGDNGDAGRAAVEKSAAVFIEAGIVTKRVFPKPEFKDWNDQLRGIQQ